MKPSGNVSCQDALFSSLFCRITLPLFFFLLIVLAPLASWAAEYINITSPVAGDVWYTGETHNIQWDTDSTSSTVTIYLYKDGVRQSPITSNAPNNGSYSWTVPCCYNGNQYAVEVWAGVLYSYNSKYEYFTLAFPSTTSPGTPTSFTATAQSSTGIDLSWNAVSDATSYDVYTCADGFIDNTAQPSYLVTGLIPQASYSYKVRSNSAEGSSDFTACQTATTLATDPDGRIYELGGRHVSANNSSNVPFTQASRR